MKEETKIKIELLRGAEGNSLYIADHRVAGNKPWGGGDLIEGWETTIEQILLAIATNQKEDKKVYTAWYNGDFKITIEKLKVAQKDLSELKEKN